MAAAAAIGPSRRLVDLALLSGNEGDGGVGEDRVGHAPHRAERLAILMEVKADGPIPTRNERPAWSGLGL